MEIHQVAVLDAQSQCLLPIWPSRGCKRVHAGIFCKQYTISGRQGCSPQLPGCRLCSPGRGWDCRMLGCRGGALGMQTLTGNGVAGEQEMGNVPEPVGVSGR